MQQSEVARIAKRIFLIQQANLAFMTPFTTYLVILISNVPSEKIRMALMPVPVFALFFGSTFPYLAVRTAVAWALARNPGEAPGARLTRILKLPRVVEMRVTFIYALAVLLYEVYFVAFLDMPAYIIPWGTVVILGWVMLVMIWTRIFIERTLMPLALEEFLAHSEAPFEGQGFLWPKQSWYLPYSFALFVLCTLITMGTVIFRVAMSKYQELLAVLDAAGIRQLEQSVMGFLGSVWLPLLLLGLFMLVSAWLLARLLPRVRFAWKLGALALLALGWLAFDQLLFAGGVQVATVLPVVSVLVSGFGVLFLGYFSVDAEKARLRDTFQHYLDASVMEQVLAHPEKLKLGGERKELTVLFSDIRGFTTLSERMSPEGLVSFINGYLTPMTDIVFEQGGTLDKYIGDAIMAFWGAPVDQPDHALRACRAALRFVEQLEVLKARWRAEGLPEVDIGVGINTGPMNVGHMGTESRFNYTVMGDAVNLGSRLEGLTKAYGIRILLAEATHRQVAGHVTTRRLGAVRVMGKREPVALHELRGLGPPVGPEAEAIRAFEEGVDRFAARDWDGAEARFREVLACWPRDVPSLRYLEEISTFRRTPPGPEWDGVYTATTK